jgi:hypothetical protein
VLYDPDRERRERLTSGIARRLLATWPSPDPRARAPRSNRPGPGCSTRRTSLPRRSSGRRVPSNQARSRPRRRPPRCLHHFGGHPAKEEGIGVVEVLDRVTMQVFVRDHCTMIAAPVQCDVDGIPKGSHYKEFSTQRDTLRQYAPPHAAGRHHRNSAKRNPPQPSKTWAVE